MGLESNTGRVRVTPEARTKVLHIIAETDDSDEKEFELDRHGWAMATIISIAVFAGWVIGSIALFLALGLGKGVLLRAEFVVAGLFGAVVVSVITSLVTRRVLRRIANRVRGRVIDKRVLRALQEVDVDEH